MTQEEMKEVQAGLQQNVACDLCGNKFKEEGRLKEHKENEHVKDNKCLKRISSPMKETANVKKAKINQTQKNEATSENTSNINSYLIKSQISNVPSNVRHVLKEDHIT